MQKALEITSDTALWYRSGTPPRPIRWVRVRDPEGKPPPQAFFSTNTKLDPAEILALFVRRWQVEVTFAEPRAHLGVQTQRQWPDKAIARTTPVLFGLYSLIALGACDLMTRSIVPYAAAWYRKTNLTFTDAIGAVRHTLSVGDLYQHSPPSRERQKNPAGPSHAHGRGSLLRRITYKVERRREEPRKRPGGSFTRPGSVAHPALTTRRAVLSLRLERP